MKSDLGIEREIALSSLIQTEQRMAQTLCIKCNRKMCLLGIFFNEDGSVSGVSGASCDDGYRIGLELAAAPTRKVSAIIQGQDAAEPISVETAEPVPTELVGDVLSAMRAANPTAPLAKGEAVLTNVCGTDVDVVTTKAIVARRK